MDCLWYKKSAKYWDEALPVGNGRIGAMVYGKVGRETIQINEESVWSGDERNRINPDSLKKLSEIRQLLDDEKVSRAQRLAVDALSGTPQYQRTYQTLGEIKITHHGIEDETESYKRELQLDNALALTEFTVDETVYRQEVFASYPDDCIVIAISSKGKKKLDFHCRLDRGRYYDRAYANGQNEIAFEGNNSGLGFYGALRCVECDGKVETIGEHLIITDASNAILLFSAATTFRSKTPDKMTTDILDKAAGRTLEELRIRHLADFKPIYGKMRLELPQDEELEKLPVDERLEQMRQGKDDMGLIALYFHYGRYLMISSSRQGGLPATLQGIWNGEIEPAWDSKYTININLQMNYWPVDVCNLSECYEPFFSLLERVRQNGKRTAKEMYGCRGFVAHHNTDIYGDTAPQDQYIPATYWVMGGAWLALHIMEHYRFTKDQEFVKKYYGILEDAVLFFEDFLIENRDGYLVTSPSVSPENTYIMKDGTKGRMCVAPAMDCEILHNLFRDFLEASDILKIENDLTEKVREMQTKIPPLRIGKNGQLMEWMEDYEEAEPGHRHISHLFGVFPGSEISQDDTPELMEAAQKTLENRLAVGGGYTGWSRAWIISWWCRFGKGNLAYENLKKLLQDSTFDNLMDNHPYWNSRGKVFQIDGNFGAIAAICEMLVQSQNGKIVILPALGDTLSEGKISGLCVRGNGQIALEWKNGKLVLFKIKMKNKEKVILEYNNVTREYMLEKDREYIFDKNLIRINKENN